MMMMDILPPWAVRIKCLPKHMAGDQETRRLALLVAALALPIVEPLFQALAQ